MTENGSTHYIVTEYVQGETLRQRITSAPQNRMKFTEAIERIIGRALDKVRAVRYQTAEDLLSDLKEVKQQIELEAKLGGTLRWICLL